MADGAILQNRWRFCRKCLALFFFGVPPGDVAGVCPQTGSDHLFSDSQGPVSGDYVLTLSVGGDFESGVRAGQRDWRFCNKCHSLWFAGRQTQGVCAAGGEHVIEGSGDYALVTQVPDFAEDIGLQRDWRFCKNCFVLWFNGQDGNNGVCPAGGEHSRSGSGDYALMHDLDIEFN
jgi:hypothetical protein